MVFIHLHCIEHETIQNPISENNIGVPLAPQKVQKQVFAQQNI